MKKVLAILLAIAMIAAMAACAQKGFFVLHNPKVFDSQDTSALPVFFLSDVFFGNTAAVSYTHLLCGYFL